MATVTDNADREALLHLLSFRCLLNDVIQQHLDLPTATIAYTLESVANEFMAAAYLPQKWCPRLPDALREPQTSRERESDGSSK